VTQPSPHTAHLHLLLERIRQGDLAARDELLRSVGWRLEQLAHKMLRRFARVRRWMDTDDVLQNSWMRLFRALQDVRPTSMRDFYNLASEQMRRELLDLARHFYGPLGLGTHHVTPLPGEEALAQTDDLGDLERWRSFHEEVERLPLEERETVNLLFYHDRTQAEAATMLQVTVRTVQRRWHTALRKLHHVLKDDDVRT
jgi:RNA polymerase sigma-70 factor (ECF subfamily)